MFSYRSNLIVSLVFALAFVVVHLSYAQSDLYGQQKRDAKHNYCGKNLSNALQLLCKGIYNPMFKKSGQEMEMDDYPYSYDYPLRSRASANAMMGRFGGARFRRQTHGVYDECCVKPCSTDELTSYCGR